MGIPIDRERWVGFDAKTRLTLLLIGLLRGAFCGWLDLGTKDWWIGLGLVISVSQSELLELRPRGPKFIIMKERMGQIAWLSHSKRVAWQLCIWYIT